MILQARVPVKVIQYISTVMFGQIIWPKYQALNHNLINDVEQLLITFINFNPAIKLLKTSSWNAVQDRFEEM